MQMTEADRFQMAVAAIACGSTADFTRRDWDQIRQRPAIKCCPCAHIPTRIFRFLWYV